MAASTKPITTRFFDDLTDQPDVISQDDLDHDADIHRVDIAVHGKLTVPVLASGGGAPILAVRPATPPPGPRGVFDWVRAPLCTSDRDLPRALRQLVAAACQVRGLGGVAC